MNKKKTMINFIDLDSMPSMADLMGQVETSTKDYIEGRLVKGTIAEKRDNGALVDIGFKAEGFVAKEEFRNWEHLAIGDVVDV